MQLAELLYRDWEKCVWRNVITCWNRLTNVRVARREEGRREGGGQDRSCVWMIFPHYAVSDRQLFSALDDSDIQILKTYVWHSIILLMTAVFTPVSGTRSVRRSTEEIGARYQGRTETYQ